MGRVTGLVLGASVALSLAACGSNTSSGGAGKDGGAGASSGGSAGAGATGGGGSSGAGTGGSSSGGTGGTGASSGTGGSSGAGTGGSGGSGTGGSGGGSGGSSGSGGTSSCGASAVLSTLGKSKLLVGASMDDATAKLAPFDVRYIYISGGYFDGNAPCASCASACTAGNGQDCSSNGGGCAWWGCWQYDQVPPGAYLRNFIATAEGDGQIPMITYYELLQASGVAETTPEVDVAAKDNAFMTKFFVDWRFTLQQIGTHRVLLHIEPDFWGYAETVGADPHSIPAAVASANPTDCANQENSIAGMGHCMIAMVRKYAKNALVGLHASAWATGPDVNVNKLASLDVAAEAQKLGTFLVGCGAADGDYVVVEASDRDAGYYTSINKNKWWDDTNTTLPTFNQHFTWAKALAEKVGKPLLWWQLPVGNMSLPNQPNAWHDNRVDYFFAHTQQVADSHGIGFAFGAGASDQTTPATDGGNLIAKVKAYKQGGGQTPTCP